MNILNKEDLEKELECVKEKIKILETMETKLIHMKMIAKKAKENNLSKEESEKLNQKINILQKELDYLDIEFFKNNLN